MRRLLLFVTVGALVTVGVLVTPAVDAFAQEQGEGAGLGIRLAEAPAGRASDARAQRYIIDHVAPGTVVRRLVEVVNDQPEAAEVRIYPAGAAVDGGAFKPSETESRDEIASWTTIDQPAVELAGRASREVTVTISVPEDAVPGERYGVIWAELPPGGEGPVAVVNRVGVRIYLSVGEGAEPASDFTVESLTAARTDDGAPAVRALVRNTGGRALDMSGELVLGDGPGGLSAGPFPAQLGSTLGIGDTAPVEVPLSEELPDGPWQATITLRSGTVERVAEATITFPAEAGTSAEAVLATATSITDSTGGRLAFALALGLALAVLVAALLFVLATRRRRKADDVLASAST